MGELTLNPLSATLLLLVMLLSGSKFRVNWKRQEAGWERRAWVYAVPAVISFCLLAFIPMEWG